MKIPWTAVSGLYMHGDWLGAQTGCQPTDVPGAFFPSLLRQLRNFGGLPYEDSSIKFDGTNYQLQTIEPLSMHILYVFSPFDLRSWVPVPRVLF